MNAIKDELLKWTCERHAADRPLDRRLLRDKALELADEYGVIGFKCSERWLTSFLRKYGFSLNPKSSIGPTFNDYRLWIDTMRSVIARYKYKDLFHLDELTMYLDVSPTRIPSIQRDKSIAGLKRATVLMCCNASGTEKLPLLICGSYPAAITDNDHEYSHSEDALISDNLLKEWLTRLNDRVSSSGREILLMLHRNHTSAFRDLKLRNVRHIFFPDNFRPLVRPLKRDVFHFVKMIYRSKYLKGIEHKCRWNAENVVRSLVEAWREVPRDLIVASFRRAGFRADDDCFLEVRCDARGNAGNEVSFRKFVTFDDDLSASDPSTSRKFADKSHGYNLRSKNVATLIDVDSEKEDSEGETPTNNYRAQSSERTRKKPVAREGKDSRRISSGIKARLYEDRREETDVAQSSERTTSGKNAAILTSPISAKLPRIIDVQRTTVNATRSPNSERSHPTRETVSAALTATTADCDLKLDETDDERRKNGRAASDERSAESLPKGADSTSGDVASQRMSDTEKANAETILCAAERDGGESTENDDCSTQKSLKRQRSRSGNAEEPRDDPDDSEPERKKSKSDSDWTKQYETTFVFGLSDSARTVPTVAADVLSDNDAQLPRPKQPCDTERNIFTIKPKKN